ncbi:hypothetical protein OIU76_026965 [Salix suchowensis]|nr:hypothetical protein OIU76_026965 [Salix suchowensis]
MDCNILEWGHIQFLEFEDYLLDRELYERRRFSPESRGTLRAFTLVEIMEGRMDKIAETWVSVCGDEIAVERSTYCFNMAISFLCD